MKITQVEQEQGQEFYQQLIVKAWENESFKNELIENPKQAIESFAGFKMKYPQGTTIRVEDQSDSSKIYLNISSKPKFENFELTDEQLEIVAGGETLFLAGVGIGIAIGAIYVTCKHAME